MGRTLDEKTKKSRDLRREAMAERFLEGNRQYKNLIAQGGPELERICGVGKGMTVSHAAAGGRRFRRDLTRKRVGKRALGSDEPRRTATSSAAPARVADDVVSEEIALLGKSARASSWDCIAVPSSVAREKRDKAASDLESVPSCSYCCLVG